MAMFGETLRQARAHKGVTLKEAEQSTRINRHHLAALEEENFSALPPLIYQRGIVRNYAVYLDLDPSKLLAMFEEAHGNVGRAGNETIAGVPPLDMPSHWAPNFAIISFAVVLGAIVFAWAYSAFVAAPAAEPTATQPVPSVTPLDQQVELPTEPPATMTPTPRPTERPTENASSRTEDTTSTRTGGGGDNQRSRSTEMPDATEETADQEPTDAPTEAPTDNVAEDGSYVTSIAVTARDLIYVEVTADGQRVFAGELDPGESTDQIAGSAFEVYTSSGVNTGFVNACNTEFSMGSEQGEA
ncbi:MAG: helix-turn-helix domain-containing protein, partial [Chloroflexota bacterium]|nr:helix-turn-helix domain-containing protein [Chloroflexota bacterium]